MAIDKLVVTENLPQLWPVAPAPNEVEPWVEQVYSADGIDRLADGISATIMAVSDVSFFVGAMFGVGLLAAVVVAYCIGLMTYQEWRENRRRDRLVMGIARRAWSELSPSEIAEAEESWPDVFLVARHLINREQRSLVERTRQVLDAWFGRQRADAIEADAGRAA
jgi:hypothetical protein